MLKKLTYLILLLGLVTLASCGKEVIDDPIDPIPPVEQEPKEYDYKIDLPSTQLLTDAQPQVVQDAPDIMIIGAVLDTFYYYHNESMSGYEYIKVYNNTNTKYNLKNHRVVLANPTQGQNAENAEAVIGNKVFCTGYLFQSLIDEDFILEPLSAGIIWLVPYYWTGASGASADSTGVFSAQVIHKDYGDKKGAMNQTISDFKDFYSIPSTFNSIYKLANMAIAGVRPEGGSDNMFPVFPAGAGSMYSHINSTLLRGIEIQRFDDQNGTASIGLLNKYSTLSTDKQTDPDPVYGKKCFNVMEIKDNNVVVNGFLFENIWKYFKPLSRINFLGKVDVNTLSTGQETVDFTNTGNTGISGHSNTVELQFRPPLVGERLMQLQLPLRELAKYDKYMMSSQKVVVRFAKEDVKEYRYMQKTIKLLVDPANGTENINWRVDEIMSEGRLSSVCPTKIKAINLTRP